MTDSIYKDDFNHGETIEIEFVFQWPIDIAYGFYTLISNESKFVTGSELV